uniref:Tesmin/TSO1-like CXC domain-containing protein n=1 Tax=Amphimedon queenslandica TaxID=400682 RepID=A0A1X7T7W9_AMPQE
MAGLKVIGEWLEDSGWVEALVQAKVASSGIADSFVKVTHVTRTRHAHQVTASSLHILLKKSYGQYKASVEPGNQPEPFEKWCEARRHESPQFQFWYTALQLEILILMFVKSLRTANFSLYTECLMHLAPWFFILDHINYARWLPVHIREMINLSKTHPEIADEFNKGFFTVQKTKHIFSSIAIDQAHEQNNASVKSDGGAIGLTQNPQALRHWMVAGPELVRITTEFESSVHKWHKHSSETLHHDQTKSTQLRFSQHVKSLVEVIEDMENPFLEESKDLLRLDTKDIMDEVVVSSICHAEEKGKEQYHTFVTNRLAHRITPLSDPIKKNKLPLFSRPPTKEKSKSSLKVSSLKSDVSLFSRLYIACQSRDGDLDDFFCHENQSAPPSLSSFGKLRHGNKADLLNCLENCVESAATQPDAEVTILDGAAVVNFLKPLAAKTFNDYAIKVFLPYIEKQLQHVTRLDIVWDRYIANSLKCHTRSNRGKGIRRRVEASANIPSNWHQFLRNDMNKTELFAFLITHIRHLQLTNKQVITTNGLEVLCIPSQDTSHLAPSDHEEADTRIILHLSDAINKGFNKILIRTVDTDVFVLLLAAAAKMKIEKLWIAFGTGKNFRYIPVHDIVTSIGAVKCRALPMFHAYTGCDTVSSFSTRGKKSAWDTWKVYDKVTETFIALSTGPAQISDGDLEVLERFTILLYDRTSKAICINEARKHLFSKKGRSMDAIPPTKAALIQHIRRAVYQGGHCWGKVYQAAMNLPSPENWGWTDTNDWKPLWTTLPEAGASSRELLCCNCKKGCRGLCKCKRAALKCTALCHCGGECID